MSSSHATHLGLFANNVTKLNNSTQDAFVFHSHVMLSYESDEHLKKQYFSFIENIKKKFSKKDKDFKDLTVKAKKIHHELIIKKLTFLQNLINEFHQEKIEQLELQIKDISEKISEIDRYLKKINLQHYDKSQSPYYCGKNALQTTSDRRCDPIDQAWLERIATGACTEKEFIFSVLLREMERDEEFNTMVHLIFNNLGGIGIHIDHILRISLSTGYRANYFPSQRRIVISHDESLESIRCQLRHEFRHAFWHLVQLGFDAQTLSVNCWHPHDAKGKERIQEFIKRGDDRIFLLAINNAEDHILQTKIQMQKINFESYYADDEKPYEREAKLYSEIPKDQLEKYYPELVKYTCNFINQARLSFSQCPYKLAANPQDLEELVATEKLNIITSPYFKAYQANDLFSWIKSYHEKGEKYFDDCLIGYNKLIQHGHFIQEAHLSIALIAMHRKDFILASNHYKKAIESGAKLSEEEETNYRLCVFELGYSLSSPRLV